MDLYLGPKWIITSEKRRGDGVSWTEPVLHLPAGRLNWARNAPDNEHNPPTQLWKAEKPGNLAEFQRITEKENEGVNDSCFL